ncbi:MAG TPA: NADH-quinone oxidoreductase subunit C [Mycobacteriales bacterium]|nr:NADH-quinone oxidoreductase subunit C [Mycobacteriales bacterium]
MAPDENVVEEFAAALDGVVKAEFGGVTVTVPSGRWVEAATAARDDPRLCCTYFDMLCGVDEQQEGFGVVMNVWSTALRHRLLLRTVVPRDAPLLASVTGVYRGAAWHERETHEMFGVIFEGHPNLVPLLLPDGFGAHPLRKDFVLAARAAKVWPGAKEPGGESARRPMLPPGQPGPDSGWPTPLPTETTRPEGRT